MNVKYDVQVGILVQTGSIDVQIETIFVSWKIEDERKSKNMVMSTNDIVLSWGCVLIVLHTSVDGLASQTPFHGFTGVGSYNSCVTKVPND
jgi:hypothetical protein